MVLPMVRRLEQHLVTL
jgi:hypothetical protein